MYYIKCFYFYSLLGFILESEVYKINNSNLHSGLFYGPITGVYGFGILSLILTKKYFLNKLKCHKFLKLIITFVTCYIILTLTELIGGIIINQLFDIDMWNYTKKQFNCGKYICLSLSLAWGLLGTIFIYYLKDFFDKFIKQIPNSLIIIITIISIIDIITVFLTK